MPPQKPQQPIRRPIQQPARRLPAAPVPKLPAQTELKAVAPANHDGFVKQAPWVLADKPDPHQTPPRLYAIIGTWYESDIIEATINNCLANGCTRIYLVDNNSPDDTVRRAMLAGAEVAMTFETKLYDDDLRVRLMNDAVKRVVEAEAYPNQWFLLLDADEFPCGPHGESLLDYVATLDRRINTVGFNAIDLYPEGPECYTRNRHPADCQRLAMRRKSARGIFCDAGHWKHSLVRFQGGNYNINLTRGLHTTFVKCILHTGKPALAVLEPPETLLMFHAPIRNKEDTYQRLRVLCDRDGIQLPRSALDDKFTHDNGAVKRRRCLEYIYTCQWDKVELPHAQIYGNNVVGIAPLPWQNLVPFKTFPRWYKIEEAVETCDRISLPTV